MIIIIMIIIIIIMRIFINNSNAYKPNKTQR